MTATIGQTFLQQYSEGLLAADAAKMAQLFHQGLAYIVNDQAREGAESLFLQETWEYIFSRVEFLESQASHVIEVHPGHLFYHEYLKVRSRASDEIREGHFGDEAVINSKGKMLLVNRVADSAYFDWFGEVLA